MWLSRALTRLSDASVRARDGITSGSEASADWDDLVLPPFVRQQIRDLVAQVRERVAVRDHWGISHRHVSVPCVAAVFHGSRGTGKTLAAEVVSRALGQDLYRVDLRTVIGRYVGETEKKLRRVFEAAEASSAVLLFEQADKLFATRADAAEGPDWYAHLASMLRTMMESYPGLIIFMTTREPAPDGHLLPCIQFIVSFPFPGPRERAEIWRRVFPTQTRTEGLDVERLSQLEVTGGQIRNIARYAAINASTTGEPIRMVHILDAVKVEYERLGRPLTSSELSGW